MTTNNTNITLIDAIKQKKGLKFIQELVSQGANINYTEVGDVWTMPVSVINFAAESGDLELVKWLKSQGAKPFTYESFSNHEYYIKNFKIFGEQAKNTNITLIKSACHSGSIELVNWLLQNGTEISEIVLSDATASQSLPLVKWLVEEKGVAIDDYAITEAIPNREMVDWLFEHGAQTRDDGMDMYMAVKSGNLELAQLLYNKGAIMKDFFIKLAQATNNQELTTWLKTIVPKSTFILPADSQPNVQNIDTDTTEFTCNNFNNEDIIKHQSITESKNDFFWNAARALNVDEERISKLSAEQIQKFTNHFQIMAFKAEATAEQALTFTNSNQVLGLELGASYDQAIQFMDNQPGYSQVSAFKAGIPFDQALKMTSYYQMEAFKSGIPLDEALMFTDWYQFEALKTGATKEQAVTFKNSYQLEAFKAGASYPKALEFKDHYQVEAIKSGIDQELALTLTFTNSEQIKAFKLGVPYDQALTFNSMYQVEAFKAGATVEQTKYIMENYYTSGLDIIIDVLKHTLKAGFTFEQSIKLRSSEVNALKKGAKYEQLINLTDAHKDILDTGVTLEQAYDIAERYKHNETELASKTYLLKYGLKAGASLEQALLLEDYQADALKHGANYSQTLNLTQFEKDALKAGARYDHIESFLHNLQISDDSFNPKSIKYNIPQKFFLSAYTDSKLKGLKDGTRFNDCEDRPSKFFHSGELDIIREVYVKTHQHSDEIIKCMRSIHLPYNQIKGCLSSKIAETNNMVIDKLGISIDAIQNVVDAMEYGFYLTNINNVYDAINLGVFDRGVNFMLGFESILSSEMMLGEAPRGLCD